MFSRFQNAIRLIIAGSTMLFYGTAAAGIIEVPPIETLYQTEAEVTAGDGGVTFDIDKKAAILVKLKGVAEISFDYHSDGYFRLDYLTSSGLIHKIDPYFLMGRPLFKGEGQLRLNFRRTINWGPDTYPLLIFSGTGTFTIKNLVVETVTDLSSYEPSKNSAFFWRPEALRSSMVGFITPVYWDFNKKVMWTNVLSFFYFFAVTALVITVFLGRPNLSRYLQKISLIFMLIFGLHFAVRFLPMVHWGFYLPASEKIKKYYPLPELGQLTATAREIIKPEDNVLVLGDEWFSPKVICFNIAPVNCSIYDPRGWKRVGSLKHRGIEIISDMKSLDSNVIVSFNSSYEMPTGFKKIYELNKNAFIAEKK